MQDLDQAGRVANAMGPIVRKVTPPPFNRGIRDTPGGQVISQTMGRGTWKIDTSVLDTQVIGDADNILNEAIKNNVRANPCIRPKIMEASKAMIMTRSNQFIAVPPSCNHR